MLALGTNRLARVAQGAAALTICLVLLGTCAADDDDDDAPAVRFGKPNVLMPPVTPPAAPTIELGIPRPAAELPLPAVPPVVAPLGQRAGPSVDELPPLQLPVVALPMLQPGPPPEPTLGLRLVPPTPAVLFRLDSEQALRDRIRKEAATNPKLPRPEFPPDRPSSPAEVPPRAWPWYTRLVEPNYLCYGRLYFQQVQSERYGHDAGVVQPLLSAGLFYADVLMLPLRVVCWPLQPYECSADGYSPFFDGWPRQR